MTVPSHPRVFESPRARRRFILHVLVLSIAFAILLVLLRRHFPVLFERNEARAFVSDFGMLSPVVLILLQALQVVIAPVPGQVLAVVAGYLFGPWWGTFYNVVGITLGSAAAFSLARMFGRSYVERVAHPEAIRWFDGIDDRHKLATLFLLFLLPGLPDDVLCFVGGLTRIPLWKLVVAAAVGRAPAFFVVNVFGDFLGAGNLPGAGVIAIVFLGLSTIGYVLRDRIIDGLAGGD